MTIFKTMARHLAGIIVGYLVAFLTAAGIGVTGEQVAQIEATVMLLLMAAFAFGWTATEKALKPIFMKYLGERQVGDDPTTIR